jgi:glucose-6-phosphate isomerase
MAFVNCEDAKLIELRPVQPADFRQTDEPDEFLGLHKAREKVTKDEFRANKALLYQSYAFFFPFFAANHTDLSLEAKQSVQTFKYLFQQVTEDVLLPDYHAAG